MAQSVFQTKETKEQAKREELIAQAIGLWKLSAEEYRILPYKYFFCLAEKRRLGLSINKLPLQEEDWPQVPLFYILSEDYAKFWLKQKTTKELVQLVEQVQEVIGYNYAYCSIKEWVRDATYLITHASPTKKSHKKKVVISETEEVIKYLKSPWE